MKRLSILCRKFRYCVLTEVLVSILLLMGCDAKDTAGPCQYGPNPDGEGCYHPCGDGWHETAAGECALDCPPMAVANEDGTCEIQACPAGWHLETDVLEDIDTVSFCARDCPAGMEEDDNGNCVIPCGEGWFKGEDGLCHLQCPLGMISKDGGKSCTLENVGENKTCPKGLWDDSIIGPNSIYVSQKTGSAEGKGTKDSPFISINQAISAMGDRATIYVATGEYNEHVLVKNKKEVNLIGTCAAQVKVAPESLPEPSVDDSVPGAIQIVDVGVVRVHGITVASPQSGIRIRHKGGYGAPDTVIVDQTIIERAGYMGITSGGKYNTMLVENNTVLQGQWGINCFSGSYFQVGEQIIRKNFVKDLSAFDPSGDVKGIIATQAAKAVVTENIVEDLAFSVINGIRIEYCLDARVERNIVDGLKGKAGVESYNNVSLTIQHNLFANIDVGSCNDYFCKNLSAGIYIHDDTDVYSAVCKADIQNNRFNNIRGFGVFINGKKNEGAEINILNNEFFRSTCGIASSSGTIRIQSNRFAKMWNSIKLFTGEDSSRDEIILEDNSFTEHAADNYGVSKDYKLIDLLCNDTTVTIVAKAPMTKVNGNTFSNSRLPNENQHIELLLSEVGDIDVYNNSFANSDGEAVRVSSAESAAFTENYFYRTHRGVSANQPKPVMMDSIRMEDNYFYEADAYLVAEEQYNALIVKNNSFVFSRLVTGLEEYSNSSLWNSRKVKFENNLFVDSLVRIGFFEEASVLNNLFKYAPLLLINGQNEDSTKIVSGNSMEKSRIEVLNTTGQTRIENNSVLGNYSRGVGIGVYESLGPVTIHHNIVDEIESKHFKTVGEVGDGIHVVGASDGDPSKVIVTDNIIRDNERLGIILHGSSGFVENNIFGNNGCGESCNVVVQKPVQPGVTGRDIRGPESRDKDYGVILPEDVLAE